MQAWKVPFHSVYYAGWLVGQVIKESVVMMIDTFGAGRRIAPVVIYYPLRVHKERDIAALAASITITPGTLALGITGPKEVDYDAEAGERSLSDAFEVKSNEFKVQGQEHSQRYMAIHAMYGQDPLDLMEGFAEMEETLCPSVKGIEQHFDVEAQVERGRPGPRGFRGSRGGRASDETVFDMEKVDSTPHAAAYVAAVMGEDAPTNAEEASAQHEEFAFRDPLYPDKYRDQKKKGK